MSGIEHFETFFGIVEMCFFITRIYVFFSPRGTNGMWSIGPTETNPGGGNRSNKNATFLMFDDFSRRVSLKKIGLEP